MGGHYPGTGIGGLFSAGGFGHLNRLAGMLIDNLLEAEVVTADGSIVTATPEKNTDLFWAIGGGSGNFGIVTWMKFKLQEAHMLLGGPVVYPIAVAADVHKNLRSCMETAKDEVNAMVGQMGSALGGGPPVCMVLAYHMGGTEDGSAEKALEPLRKFGEPIADMVAPIPYLALQNMFNVPTGPASYYDTSVLLGDLSNDAIAVLVELGQSFPTPQSQLVVMGLGGAVTHRSPSATPFFHRNAKWWVLIIARFETGNTEERAKSVAWAKHANQKLHPFSVGLYAGEVRGDTVDPATTSLKSFFSDNLPRLQRIKHKYDPDNVFHHNRNILPADTP